MEDRKQINLYKRALAEHEAELTKQREDEEAWQQHVDYCAKYPKRCTSDQPSPRGYQRKAWQEWLWTLVFGFFLLITLATIAMYLIGFARLGI